MDSSGYLAYTFESERTPRPILHDAKLTWYHRLESYFPDFVRDAIITPSCIHAYEGDPDMVGSKVIVDNGGYVKFIFTINKGGQSASIVPMER